MKITKKAAIRTERLELGAVPEKDREQLVRILRNEEVCRTFMIPDYPDPMKYYALADRIIALSRPDEEKRLEYGVYLGDRLIGFINDCGYDDEKIEIGYVIHPDFKGRGYCTEAVKAVIGELFSMGFSKVVAGFFEENEASHRVMEKCGMRLNGGTGEEDYRGKKHKVLYCEIKHPQEAEE